MLADLALNRGISAQWHVFCGTKQPDIAVRSGMNPMGVSLTTGACLSTPDRATFRYVDNFCRRYVDPCLELGAGATIMVSEQALL